MYVCAQPFEDLQKGVQRSKFTLTKDIFQMAMDACAVASACTRRGDKCCCIGVDHLRLVKFKHILYAWFLLGNIGLVTELAGGIQKSILLFIVMYY